MGDQPARRVALCGLLTALMLALTIRLYERYHSLDLDEILILAKEEERT